jgi:hypothetical protein
MNALFLPSRVTFEKIERDDSISRRWQMSGLDMTANVVCKRCNETWMSRIETDHAKPAMSELILGKHVNEITAERARSIAIFAFKTAVIANHMLPNDEEFFATSLRYRFRKSLRIPRGVCMYLVGLPPDKTGGIRTTNVFSPDQRTPKFILNVCSFHIGQLGFQVVSFKSQSTLTQIESLPTPPDLTVVFHPTIRSGVSWPRRTLLGQWDFGNFANRWNAVKWH